MEALNVINKHKNKILNIAIIILIIIIANKLYQKQNSELAMIKAKNDALVLKNGVLENIGKTEMKINAYRNLLTRKDENQEINAFNALAQGLNIIISSVRPLPEEKRADYIKFPFDLSISVPNYHALGKFISELESSKDVYQVEVIIIKPKRQEKALEVNLKISSVVFAN